MSVRQAALGVVLSLVVILALGSCAATGDRPLQLVSAIGPTYPAAAKAAGVEGFVTVEYSVSVDGVVGQVQVIESQPPGVFDKSAVAAVQRWRYNPPRLSGVPQAVPSATSTLRFELDGAERYQDL